MSDQKRLPLDLDYVRDFCRRHHVRRLSLFGSALNDRFDADSDIDLLAEFEPDARVSLFDVGGMMYELTKKIGRQVDIRTPADLHRSFRSNVIRQAELLYDKR